MKLASELLRGTLAAELENGSDSLSSDAEQIIKHHGAYLQDNRDLRRSGTRQHSFLVRTRLPGGKLTGAQFRAEIDLCDELGDGTLRITDRQGLQLHGILKSDLRETIRRIDAVKMTTLGACGDVVRNVMCCPAPLHDSPVRSEMQSHADALARHFALRTRAYYDIWLKTEEENERVGGAPDDEPVYGAAYLPRKFKFALALPDDNCVDALTHDVGFVALPGSEANRHFNVYVGGGMGVTPARTDTFPAVAQPLARISADALIPLAHAIVQVQKEFGNRSDRKRARLKYLIAEWGIERFREMLNRVYGKSTSPAEDIPIVGLQDHLGWNRQGGRNWFLGLSVASGRIKDDGAVKLKSALRAVTQAYPISIRLTPLQDILLCDIPEESREDIEKVLRAFGVLPGMEIDPVRRLAIACPALPTCGLAITESERALPALLDSLHSLMQELGLGDERLSLRMTGCPNGCTRPYVAEIGIVGKAVGRYTLFLRGSQSGTRLALRFRESQTPEEILATLRPILREFAGSRLPGESFGYFCNRLGTVGLAAIDSPTVLS